jgi:cytochrome c peroxidase
MTHRIRVTTLTLSLLLPALAGAAAMAPRDFLSTYEATARKADAGFTASAPRGQAFFTARHGNDWTCASCHTSTPSAGGRHVVTGKAIAPLAPSAQPDRLTDPAKVEKWFGRNCQDVLGRECNPREKADVVAWLLTIR